MKYVLVKLIQAYRLLLSPWLGASCRFEPTCSHYALEALQQHGTWNACRLTGWRILRCNPWCDGGHDPVPKSRNPFFNTPMDAPSAPSSRDNT